MVAQVKYMQEYLKRQQDAKNPLIEEKAGTE